MRLKHCLKPVCQFVDDFDDVVVVLGAAPGQQEAVCLSGGVADHGDVFAGKRMESVQVGFYWKSLILQFCFKWMNGACNHGFYWLSLILQCCCKWKKQSVLVGFNQKSYFTSTVCCFDFQLNECYFQGWKTFLLSTYYNRKRTVKLRSAN